MSSFIHGSPMLSTGERTGVAFGSNTVGGTGSGQSRLSGIDGLTIWIEEVGARFSRFVGMAFLPPPLP